jgi:hypothetical protein
LKGKFYLSAINFFNKRNRLVNENYEDLSDPIFRTKYKEISNNFLNKTKKQLMQYLKYSEYIQHHNEKAGFNVKKEIFENNQEAVKFLSQLQKQIRTKPSNYLYLKDLRK